MVVKTNVTKNNTFVFGVLTRSKKDRSKADDSQPQKIK